MCSVISLKGDKIMAVARNMDFNIMDIGTQKVVIPAGRTITSYASRVKFDYEVHAMSNHVSFDFVAIQEAVNSAGLHFSLLYNIDNSLASTGGSDQILLWCIKVIGQCKDVAAVKAELAKVTAFYGPEHKQATCHLFYTDTSGAAIVVEFDKGKPTVYDAPLGVMTNGPDYSWHLTNLRGYLNVNPNGVEKRDLLGVTFEKMGHGNGFLGVPGGNGSPDRFIRLALNKAFANRKIGTFNLVTDKNVVAKCANILGLAYTAYGTQTSDGWVPSLTGQDQTLWTSVKWIDADGKPHLAYKEIADLNFKEAGETVNTDA